MISNKLGLAPTIKDGDYEIIFSETFNLYEKKITLSEIAGFTIEIHFKIDNENANPHFEIKSGDGLGAKKVHMNFFNFASPLGSCTTNIIPLIQLSDSRQLYFSVHAKSVGEPSTFIQASITFYLK